MPDRNSVLGSGTELPPVVLVNKKSSYTTPARSLLPKKVNVWMLLAFNDTVSAVISEKPLGVLTLV